MSSKMIFAVAFGGLVLAAAPALAWGENTYSQPASGEIAVWAYPSAQNYCPAGLQPVTIGGVICCGQPTHVGYQAHQTPAPRKRHKHTPKPYVAYGKGYNEGYVATGKGYGEGYKN